MPCLPARLPPACRSGKDRPEPITLPPMGQPTILLLTGLPLDSGVEAGAEVGEEDGAVVGVEDSVGEEDGAEDEGFMVGKEVKGYARRRWNWTYGDGSYER